MHVFGCSKLDADAVCNWMQYLDVVGAYRSVIVKPLCGHSSQVVTTVMATLIKCNSALEGMKLKTLDIPGSPTWKRMRLYETMLVAFNDRICKASKRLLFGSKGHGKRIRISYGLGRHLCARCETHPRAPCAPCAPSMSCASLRAMCHSPQPQLRDATRCYECLRWTSCASLGTDGTVLRDPRSTEEASKKHRRSTKLFFKAKLWGMFKYQMCTV